MLRNEICVEDCNEIGTCLGQGVIDIARFGVGIIRPRQITDAFGFAEGLDPKAPAIIESGSWQ
jgi:hypothetical protein